MRKRGTGKLWLIIISAVCFLGVFAGVFFGVQFATKTGIFKIPPGVVYYDDSLSDEEKAELMAVFDGVELKKDVKILAWETLELDDLNANQFLKSVKVAVTNFYNFDNKIEVSKVSELYEKCDGESCEMISASDLNYTKRLMRVNEKYYLDNFDAGAVFRVIEFESEAYDAEILPLVKDLYPSDFLSRDEVLTLAQTGVTAMSRGMNRKLYEVEDAKYFAEKIGDYLSSFDLTHTSNEASFSEWATVDNICSDPRFMGTLREIGLDIVELTGNHNQDCGDESAVETIDTYSKYRIKVVGGGKTAEEAAKPLEISEKGTKITMLAFNESTGGATYDDTPGANQYDEELAAEQISAAKKRGDFVIVDIQYYECSMYVSEEEDTTCDAADSSAGDQIGLFRQLIDMGADVVVGTSAHQPQTFELYGKGAIYYGLGNLFFDQVWWPGTTRSLILVHHLYDGKLLQTEIVPTVYDENMQTELLNEEKTLWFLKRLADARP